ncbi:MAG: PD-(D/E)XK nuclease family protein [Bacteroidota bacterium]
MEIHQFQNLLYQVNAITDRYKKVVELTGENFNIFRILKVESSEVKTHSAFISELLKPYGSHGQKDTFLKLFVEVFCFKGNLIDTRSCKVKVEEFIGMISEDKTEGGRIDITITDKNFNKIIIENKIYADDQSRQLERYNKHSQNADLIYLTLFGKQPGEHSKGVLKEKIHFKCYSYERDILNWLELCRKEAAIYPIVREGITHYINLIKYLTNQTLNKNMQDELSDLLKSNLEASFAIYDNLDRACDKISDDFGKKIEAKFESMNLKCKYGISFKDRYNGIWIWKPEWKYFNIGFQFQSFDNELRYGIVAKKNPGSFTIPAEIRNKIALMANNTPKLNPWWAWYRQMEEPYSNWGKFEAWKAILDGSMERKIVVNAEYLLTLFDNLEL